jgi:glutathione S-transferase
MATDTALSQTLTHTLTMTRRFAAKRELVFAAISQAEHMQQWMCPADFSVPNATADVRVGGRFHIHMVSPEGNHFKVGGEYLVVDPPRRLIFTWTWEPGHTMPNIETTVSIELTEKNGETLLTMTHMGLPSEEERASHEFGWTGAYESLGRVVATLSAAESS